MTTPKPDHEAAKATAHLWALPALAHSPEANLAFCYLELRAAGPIDGGAYAALCGRCGDAERALRELERRHAACVDLLREWDEQGKVEDPPDLIRRTQAAIAAEEDE